MSESTFSQVSQKAADNGYGLIIKEPQEEPTDPRVTEAYGQLVAQSGWADKQVWLIGVHKSKAIQFEFPEVHTVVRVGQAGDHWRVITIAPYINRKPHQNLCLGGFRKDFSTEEEALDLAQDLLDANCGYAFGTPWRLMPSGLKFERPIESR